MSSSYDETMIEIKQEYDLSELTTPIEQTETREIEQKDRKETHLPPPTFMNPYSGLTNTGIRKRKEREAKNDGSPESSDHPFAPPGKKAKAKKPAASGKLVDTRTMQTYTRGDIQALKYAITLLQRIEEAPNNDLPRLYDLLRAWIHQTEFRSSLCHDLVADSKLLESQGLSKIFGDDRYPPDLRDDALVVYQRWLKGLYDPHLLRGVEVKNRVQSAGKTTKSRNLETSYEFKISAHYIGAGDLVNGQWWPLQICAIRDGAHGESEAGICGKVGQGVFSVVISNSDYANIDNGDEIRYCGTSGSAGQATLNTKLMIESHGRRNPVRVIRSGANNTKHKTVYQPVMGLRYDGLYEIVGDELLHEATAMHRFTLRRLAGQHPIRYRGVEARPTPEERAAYESIREKLGYKS